MLSSPQVVELRESRITAIEFEFLRKRYLSRLVDGAIDDGLNEDDVLTLLDTLSDQEALIMIGRSLSIEKNPDKLLRSMLFLSKKITGADAGSIFLVEEEGGTRFLRFKYSHTFSRDLKYEEARMPLDTHSIAGYVALTGRVLNIPDVYDLKDDDPIVFNPEYDHQNGYRSRSMLVVPMKNHLDDIIGVIQLINSKEQRLPGQRLSGNEAFQVTLKVPRGFRSFRHTFSHPVRSAHGSDSEPGRDSA